MIYYILFIVLLSYYIGFNISRKIERERQRRILEDNLEKVYIDVLNNALPRERIKRWN